MLDLQEFVDSPFWDKSKKLQNGLHKRATREDVSELPTEERLAFVLAFAFSATSVKGLQRELPYHCFQIARKTSASVQGPILSRDCTVILRQQLYKYTSSQRFP